jgi:hypothetical protein
VTTTNAAPKWVDHEYADDPQGWTFDSALGLSMLLILVLALQGPTRGVRELVRRATIKHLRK